LNHLNGHYEQSENPTLSKFFRILRRRWVVALLAVVLVPGIAGAYALSQEKEYSTSSSLLFRNATEDGPLSGDEERGAATNVSLASLGEVAERTATTIGGGLSAGEVSRSVDVQPDGADANVLTVSVSNTDPELAAKMANTYAREFVLFRRNADRKASQESLETARRRIRSINTALVRLANQTPAPNGTQERARQNDERRSLIQTREQLTDEARRLDAQATLATGNVELVERAAVPGSASSPKPQRMAILGLGFGLLLGIGLALLFELLDRRVRDPKEVEAILRRPTLGAIPLSPAFARNGRRPSRRRGLSTSDMEAFHMLRANLRYFDFQEPIKSVVVTSAAPGEGKSTVAWNLAAAGANAGLNTLLMEAELRRPTLVREFHLPEGPGLSDILLGDAEQDDVIQRFPVSKRSEDDPSGPAMDVIVAGRRVPNPADLLDSQRMQKLIRDAEQQYELVVIDTPPVAVVSDAIPLLARAGGVIIVSRIGHTTRDAAEHLRGQLEGLNARLLGVVINGVSSHDGGFYGSAYEYADRYGPAPKSG
jgi:capsular exopolysaccharide synthesis family protein